MGGQQRETGTGPDACVWCGTWEGIVIVLGWGMMGMEIRRGRGREADNCCVAFLFDCECVDACRVGEWCCFYAVPPAPASMYVYMCTCGLSGYIATCNCNSLDSGTRNSTP